MFMKTNARQINPPRCKKSAPWEEVQTWKEDPRYIYEQKFDGRRYLLQIRPNNSKQVYLTSRRISVDTNCFVEKQDMVTFIRDTKFPPILYGAVFDGEIMGGKTSSETITHMVKGDVTYQVWDILFWQDVDYRFATWNERHNLLIWLSKHFPAWMKATKVFDNPEGLIRRMGQKRVEGIVRKESNKPYGECWVKAKMEETYDVVVFDYEETNSKAWADKNWIGAVRIGQWRKIKSCAQSSLDKLVPGCKWRSPNRQSFEFVDVGRCSNFDYYHRKLFSENREKYVGQVIEIKCQNRLKSGKFHHPRFVKLRDDKPHWDCTLEVKSCTRLKAENLCCA
jgi:ATP-dependent DNA ligase